MMSPIAVVTLFLFSPPAPPESPLRIVATASQLAIAVGEPIRVDLLWSSPVPVSVVTNEVELLVDRGDGYEVWGETPETYALAIGSPRTVRPSAPIRTAHLICVTGPRDGRYSLAFPQPGTFRVKARYHSTAVTTSNALEFVATTPSGIDRLALNELIARYPEYLSAHSHLMGDSFLRRTFAEYGGSRYTDRPQLLYLERKVRRAIWDAPEPPHPSAPVGGDVPTVLAELAGATFETPLFDEERLLVLARVSDDTGRPREAEVHWRNILARYPDGLAGDLARKRLRIAQAVR